MAKFIPKDTDISLTSKKDIFRVEKHSSYSDKSAITINKRTIDKWFKEQFDKLNISKRAKKKQKAQFIIV